jgi:hypothetical protein
LLTFLYFIVPFSAFFALFQPATYLHFLATLRARKKKKGVGFFAILAHSSHFVQVV